MFFAIRQFLLVLPLAAITLLDNYPLSKPPRDSEPASRQVRRWLKQWEAYIEDVDDTTAAKSPGLKLTSLSAAQLSEYLAEMEQCKSAMALCKRLRPSEEAHKALANLPAVFISAGNVPEAYYVVSTLEDKPPVKIDGKTYNRYLSALHLMADAHAKKADYVPARKIIQKIEKMDADRAAFLGYQLARFMASHGQYDKAVSCVEEVPEREAVKGYRKHTLQIIRRYREGNVNRYRHIRKTRNGIEKLLQTLRAGTGIMVRSKIPTSVDSVRERNEYISSIEDPSRRAALWREAAWNHWRANRVRLSRKAAYKCHEAVLRIPQKLGDFRLTESVLLADLYFVMGDTEQAIGLVKEMIANKDERSSIGFGEVMGSGALMASVLVRAGEVSMAFEVAKQDWNSEFSVHQWGYLGTICAFCVQIEHVEAQLDDIDNELAKAFLCLGVAYGLHEKKLASCQSDMGAEKRTSSATEQ